MEDSIKLEVNRREVYRYLGLGRHEPDERTALLVEESLVELENAAAPRFFSRSYPLSVLPDGKLDLTCFRVESRDLSRNLKDCEEVILFAATLGTGPDLLVRRYSRLEMSRAVVVQAAAPGAGAGRAPRHDRSVVRQEERGTERRSAQAGKVPAPQIQSRIWRLFTGLPEGYNQGAGGGEDRWGYLDGQPSDDAVEIRDGSDRGRKE